MRTGGLYEKLLWYVTEICISFNSDSYMRSSITINFESQWC